MDWKDLASVVGKSAPLLGSLVAGPAGGAVGSLIASVLGVKNTPDAVSQALTINPDAAVKLAEIEAKKQTELQSLLVQSEANRLKNEADEIKSVNMSIQSEAKSDHWPTYTWRPFIGFCFGFYIISLCTLPLFHIQPVTLTADITFCIGGILGIASFFRGKAQADPNVKIDSRG